MQDEKKTDAQLITELVVSRKVKKIIGYVPDKFWNLPEWKKEFQRQVIKANSLLKLFSYSVIMEVLNSKEYNWVYSLSNPKLVESMRQVQVREEIREKIASTSKPIVIDKENSIKLPKVSLKKDPRNLLDD